MGDLMVIWYLDFLNVVLRRVMEVVIIWLIVLFN